MTAIIAGEPVTVMVYAWSNSSVTYLVTNCDTTTTHPIPYCTKFIDEHNEAFHDVDCPSVAHFIFQFLPLIDEHNKQRQGILGLERKWLTKNCWNRVVTTLLGQSVVDMHRWDRYQRNRHLKRKRQPLTIKEDQKDKVKKFSAQICKWLLTLPTRDRKSQRVNPSNNNGAPLKRIRDKQGRLRREPTEKQKADGRNEGTSVQLACWVCHHYLLENNKTKYQHTSF